MTPVHKQDRVTFLEWINDKHEYNDHDSETETETDDPLNHGHLLQVKIYNLVNINDEVIEVETTEVDDSNDHINNASNSDMENVDQSIASTLVLDSVSDAKSMVIRKE